MDLDSINSTAGVYTMGTASVLSGIPIHSIRQYVDKKLILPFKKKSNRNLFSQFDILRLKFIHKLLVKEGLNIAGIKSLFATIPCWAVTHCSTTERKKCRAFTSNSHPCWEASRKGKRCMNVDCRNCDIYRVVENYPDIKTFLKTIIVK